MDVSITARKALVAIHMDYYNNYLTKERFAEHNRITEEEAVILLDLAYRVFHSKDPDW